MKFILILVIFSLVAGIVGALLGFESVFRASAIVLGISTVALVLMAIMKRPDEVIRIDDED